MNEIPIQISRWIGSQSKEPRSYKQKYVKRMNSTNLVLYTEENLSLDNITTFINSPWNFLNDIQDDYASLRQAYLSDEADLFSEDPIELRRSGISLVASKLKNRDLDLITRYHQQLSVALGRPVGMNEQSDIYEFLSPTDFVDAMLESLYNETFKSMVDEKYFIKNEIAELIQNFLRSKDDSLILLLCSLFYSYMNSREVDPAIYLYSNLFPIGKQRMEDGLDGDENIGRSSNFLFVDILIIRKDQILL